jgi:hypothetical protein
MVVHRGNTGVSNAKKYSWIYPEERNLTLDTNVWSVVITILSARSEINPTTLACTFEYLGSTDNGLSPFFVGFVSHRLENLLQCSPGVYEVIHGVSKVVRSMCIDLYESKTSELYHGSMLEEALEDSSIYALFDCCHILWMGRARLEPLGRRLALDPQGFLGADNSSAN